MTTLGAELKAEKVDEIDDNFWSNSSYKVNNKGQTSTAIIDFIVPSDRLNKPPGQGNAVEEQRATDAAATGERDEWALQRTKLDPDEINFPWACSSAVSKQIFAEGLHEILVRVGSSGLLGFVDAQFVDERIKVAQSWVTEGNVGRAWTLHSSGYIADGHRHQRMKDSKFSKGDTIQLRLDQFKGSVSWTFMNGAPRHMGSVDGITVPVRLGFQMQLASDSITVISCKDITDEMDPKERADSHLLRAERYLRKAAPLSQGGPDTDEEYVNIMKIAMSALDKASRAYSNLQDAACKDKSLSLYTDTKAKIDAAQARIDARFG